MLLAKVIGSITSTIKHPSLHARKILVVKPIVIPVGSSVIPAKAGIHFNSKSVLALDTVQAGVGDVVLINQEGGSCRQVLQDKEAPVNHTIIGIVDYLS